MFYCIFIDKFFEKIFFKNIFFEKSLSALKVAKTSVNLTPSKKNMKNEVSWNREKEGEKSVTKIDDVNDTKIKIKKTKIVIFLHLFTDFLMQK